MQHSLFNTHLSLSLVLDQLGQITQNASTKISKKDKALKSQFFTHQTVANQMSNMLTLQKNMVIGDHGAGAGILGASVISNIIDKFGYSNKPLELNAFEIDDLLYSAFTQSTDVVGDFAEFKGVSRPTVNLKGDFTSLAEEICSGTMNNLDAVIINPPYQKLNQQTPLANTMRSKLVATPNLYAVFIALSIMMLKDGGEIVAIVPRSFTSGTYFKAFRSWLLNQGSIDWIVRYNSRSNLFRGDNVLQENVIFKFTTGVPQAKTIKMSICDTPNESPLFETDVLSTDLLQKNGMIFIPATEEELRDLTIMRSKKFTHADLNLKFSTGKLEDFRMKKSLRAEFKQIQSCPIIYSQHWDRGSTELRWSKNRTNKPCYILLSDATKKIMTPRGNYVLIKRISANDDRSARCNPCALYEDSDLEGNLWAIDNHVQVISPGSGKPFTKAFVRELAAYLATPEVDRFLRAVSGTTQLNVSDLKQIRYSKKLFEFHCPPTLVFK